MRLPRRPRVVVMPAFCGIAAALSLVACSSSGSNPGTASTVTLDTPPAGSSPVVQSSPTPPPADPALADRLRYEGEFERAADVYGAVANQQSGSERQAALLSQAQLLSRLQRFPETRDVLQQYIVDAGPSADGSSAQFMLASTLDDLGDAQGALTNYDRYIAANGAASDFARIERAKMLARLGRTIDAEQAAEAVLLSKIDQSFKASFTFSMASAFEKAGGDANALAWYNRVTTTDGGDAASALARVGAIKKRLGDATWVQDYLAAINANPAGADAPDLLDSLDQAHVAVPDYMRGLVNYRAHRDDAARPALLAAIASGQHAAEAHYYLAAIEERAGHADAAIAEYATVPQTDPASPLAADALWWQARLLEAAGRYNDGAIVYASLAAQYPRSSRAGDAAFRQALALYRTGDRRAAIDRWASLAARTTGSDNRRARFWQGRALIEENGDSNDGVLTSLMSDAPGDFYALRAEVVLKKNDSKDHKEKLSDSAPDWGKISAFIQKQTGTDPEQESAAVLVDPRWAEAAELVDVGLPAQADRVFTDIISEHDGDPIALYAATKRLQEDGRTDLSARAATRLINAIVDPNATPPDDLLRVAYPVVYKGLVDDATKAEKMSPLLLLALVRQESFYDPDAGSTAGALGLTQVVPSTGETISKELGRASFTATDLYRPNVNLRFGAQYLASQLSDFGSDPYHALAAYNGGPGTASAAADAAGGDEDLFVEQLEFDETQAYVKRVMENYARYRQLYGGADRPSLPR